MAKAPLRPFLISSDEDGRYHLTIRETRENSQGYAWVKVTVHEESFDTLAAAKAYARDELGAQPGDYARK